MWMFLGPCFMSALSSWELLPAGWCGEEDGTGLDLRIVGGGGGFLLAVTSR
ncbi:hypothetical protein CQR44_1159 [Bifidobacterium asteroides]|uniref:Uncharacterized protein n=1 Tax=Bifidobacterium asteroides TaxID=1684 RepID=A0A2N3RAX2_9BIFI|nr:hypothetical protein CQR44_1159 [Bifidobacterium asteroides]